MDVATLGQREATSRRRGPRAFVVILAALVVGIVALAVWWAYPRVFPVEAIQLKPGDAYTALSGVTITVPGQQAAQAYRERRPAASSSVGIADSLELAKAMPGFPDVTVFSYWDAARNRVFRGVAKTYALVGSSDGGASEVRWRDFGADGSALAVVTRVPGHDTGMVLAFGVPGVTSAASAREAASRLWSQLSAQGASPP
jgi:hypothetical protein